jgi:hypothetical protein
MESGLVLPLDNPSFVHVTHIPFRFVGHSRAVTKFPHRLYLLVEIVLLLVGVLSLGNIDDRISRERPIFTVDIEAFRDFAHVLERPLVRVVGNFSFILSKSCPSGQCWVAPESGRSVLFAIS